MSASGGDDAVISPPRVRQSSGGFPVRWVVPALAALVIAGGVGSYLWMRDKTPNCATERVDALAADTTPEKLISAGLSCRDAAMPNDPLPLAAAARLFRMAADSGYCQGALRLGELYDPAELRAGRIGQQPGDYRIAFDNYARALRLGCDEAQPRLRDLRTVVEAKWRGGDPEAELVLQRWPSGRPH
jgi:TPR repeat protein